MPGSRPRRSPSTPRGDSLSADTPVASLGLSARPANALARKGIRRLGELIPLREKDLLHFPALGASCLREIKQALDARGLHLGGSITAMETGEGFLSVPLLGRRLSPADIERLKQTPVTSLPGNPGGRVRTLLERLELRTLHQISQLDPEATCKLPNVGRKTVESLTALLEQWLRLAPKEAPQEEAKDPAWSPVLRRRLTPAELESALRIPLPAGSGPATLLEELLAPSPIPPDSDEFQEHRGRMEALLHAACHQDANPSEFLGFLLEAAHLTPREALVLRLRWDVGVSKPESLREIGDRFGFSGEWARSTETAVIRRLREYHAAEQVHQYVRGLARKVRWPASFWGLQNAAEMQESLAHTLGPDGWKHLREICLRMLDKEPLEIVREVLPHDPNGKWFARSEETLRLAQAWNRMPGTPWADGEPPPELAGWEARVRAACGEEAEEEELEDLEPEFPAAVPPPPAESASLAFEEEPEEDPDDDLLHREPAPVPSPARAKISVPPAPPGETVRGFVQRFLDAAGGSARLREVVAAAEMAGHPGSRVLAVCRNLHRRFEIRENKVFLRT
ncbi:MAG: DNA-directed RNA polymerase subunit alpha C-terminal domain-containing protein [Planctomycetota bacterium]